MPATSPRATAIRVVRRQRSLARTATLAGLAGLALVAVVAMSAVLAAVAGHYAGGILLGAGIVGLAWGISTTRRRLGERRVRVPGRSRTLDCDRSRLHRPRSEMGKPHFPAPADRRVVPCRNSRYPGR